MKPLKPTKEAFKLALDLRDIADRLEIMAKHLVAPSHYSASADTMSELASRLMKHSVNWEIARIYSRTE